MNYYFLVEDEKSLMKVLPHWLKLMDFPAKRVGKISDATEECYVLKSGMGCYNLVDQIIPKSIEEISQNGKIGFLVILIDSESYSVNSRLNHVINKCKEEIKVHPIDCQIKTFVINCCFETWLLGNVSYFPNIEPTQSSFFYPYHKFYDVSVNDPEMMPADENNPKYPDYHFRSKADYHFRYFHEMCRYKGVGYRKSKPNVVQTEEFFNEIIKRIGNTNHLNSFKEFYEFIKECSRIPAK